MGLHKDQNEANMHEPKGVQNASGGVADAGKVVVTLGDGSSEVRKLDGDELASTGATSGELPVSDGTGGTSWLCARVDGFYDYNHSSAVGQLLSPALTFVPLVNDGAGANTNLTYAVPGVAHVWNTVTNQMDFTLLENGDTIDLRVDVEVTTTGANHEVVLAWELGIGGFNYTLQILRQNFKVAGTYIMTVLHSAYIGDDNTRLNPAEIQMLSDDASDSVAVNGFYIRVNKRIPQYVPSV